MSYKNEKSAPIIEVMGPEVYSIFQITPWGTYEVDEFRDLKKAQAALRELRASNPDTKYTLKTEERPDMAPNTPVKKFQPSGWKL